MHLARLRTLFFLASNACASFLGAGIYLEYHLGPSLNPLCLLQRCLYAAYGVICLLAVVHAPGKRGWRAYSGGLLLIAASGAAIAGRQVFLQASPPEDMASCLANLHYLVDTQPYLKVLILVLQGNAGCSEINWSLFGLSIPEWSLLAFTGLSLFALYFLLIDFMRFRSMDADVRD
jgi:disulfide bond formation protein DsbB